MHNNLDGHKSKTKSFALLLCSTVSVVPVDQVGNPVNATIQGHLNLSRSDLVEGQVTHITQNCNSIQFRIVSPHISEQLTVYASDGPCKDAALQPILRGIILWLMDWKQLVRR